MDKLGQNKIQALRAKAKLRKDFGGEEKVIKNITDLNVLGKKVKKENETKGPRKTSVVVLMKHADENKETKGLSNVQKFDPQLGETACLHSLRMGVEL
jgi:hypothetical protein